jgi:uncharacterized protein YndB with AHSA1/START domain
MSPMTSTDRFERTIQLSSPRSRVWRALTDPQEFGSWFGMRLDGPFVAGAATHGHLTVKGYEDLDLTLVVETLEPERRFAFRWHPYAIERDVDYSKEPMTLVSFTLEPIGDGTRLTVVESGFDAIPAARRTKAFQMNEKGWTSQLENIRAYLAKG